MTEKQKKQKQRAPAKAQREEDIAILDMETDPFDNTTKDRICPFLAVLYSDQFETVVIWDEDERKFVDRLIAAIEALPRRFTIYAHNGGKFDYMFLVKRLRGNVSFKGRGIMAARIGAHELRDSFHIIPERLANYKKDDIDYSVMKKSKRAKHRKEIIDYCIADCRYLLDIVKTFVSQNGLKLSIGQAAMYALRQEYKVEKISEQMDAFLRHFFFGGRVECLDGMGHFIGDYKLYDVNSMYPFVMATRQHPIGRDYTARRGQPGEHTVFIDITCKNYGALIGKTDAGETTANIPYGRFKTTIWEYEVALKYGLISHVKIHACIDCKERSDFSRFITPLYHNRLATKELLKSLEPNSAAYNEAKKDDIFYKLFLNNAYGKFAQNPRRYKEHYITDVGERPPPEELYGKLPAFECEDYAIWEKPCPRKSFNNVGTAASITGAARAVLLEAIQNAVDPIYCDTDSLICKALNNHTLHASELGAWDLEAEFTEVVIAGKKLYGIKSKKDASTKVKSKGFAGVTWDEIIGLLDQQIYEKVQKGVTMTKRGDQFYMRRSLRATGTRYSTRYINQRMRA